MSSGYRTELVRVLVPLGIAKLFTELEWHPRSAVNEESAIPHLVIWGATSNAPIPMAAYGATSPLVH